MTPRSPWAASLRGAVTRYPSSAVRFPLSASRCPLPAARKKSTGGAPSCPCLPPIVPSKVESRAFPALASCSLRIACCVLRSARCGWRTADGGQRTALSVAIPPRLTSSSMAAIVLERLTKFYGKSRGVLGLDLEVAEGEVFGFLGPNGAGKTTTIRTLLDLIRPSSGSARVLGHDSVKDSVAIRRRVGYLPGELSLWETMTTRQVLDHLGHLRGRGRQRLPRRAARAPRRRAGSQDPRPLQRQPPEGGDHPGVHAPARADHPR